MDMHKKRELRAKKKQEIENGESCTSVNINWYPGHMAKTKRLILEDLKLIDIVVELLDARIPLASQNPNINEYRKGKLSLVILNKCDLANPKQNQKWIEYFAKKKIPAVLVDSQTGTGIKSAISKMEEIYEEQSDKFSQKGRVGKSIRVMILGIPNVGKSSFINRITKKGSTKVGNRPGVTRQKQWVRITENIELMDTPGVLWPKFESQEVGLKLAYTGTIKDEIMATLEVGFSLLTLLLKNYQSNIVERFKLDEDEVKNIMENEEKPENERVLEVMHLIGRKRGALMQGANIDEEKVAKIILDDFRAGRMGKISLEII